MTAQTAPDDSAASKHSPQEPESKKTCAVKRCKNKRERGSDSCKECSELAHQALSFASGWYENGTPAHPET